MRPTKKTRNPIYRGFNWFMEKTTAGYSRVVAVFVRKFVIALVLFGGISFGAYWGFVQHAHRAFVPGEDQGYAIIDIQLPGRGVAEPDDGGRRARRTASSPRRRALKNAHRDRRLLAR